MRHRGPRDRGRVHPPTTPRREHRGYQAVQGTGRSTRLVNWIGGAERAMVVDGYSWNRLPGTDVEVRALTDKPLALRYRPQAYVN